MKSGLFFFLMCVCELVGMCMCMSVTLVFSSGACCLGRMVQPGASAPQRGLLLTTCHHRWRRSLTKALPRSRDHRAFLDASDIAYDFNNDSSLEGELELL